MHRNDILCVAFGEGISSKATHQDPPRHLSPEPRDNQWFKLRKQRQIERVAQELLGHRGTRGIA
jgi:hypothetical protein